MVDMLTGKNIKKVVAKEVMPWELAHDHAAMSPEDSARCKIKDEHLVKMVIPEQSEYVKVAVDMSMSEDYIDDVDAQANKKLKKPQQFIWKRAATMKD